MLVRLFYLLLLALQCGVAYAGINNPGSSGGGPAVNLAQSGVVGFDAQSYPFVNFMKMATGGNGNTGTTFIYPNYLAQGTNLPIATTLPNKLGYGIVFPTNYFGHFEFAMAGTLSGGGITGWQFGTAAFGTIYSKSAGTTLVGCNNGNAPPCNFGNNIILSGTNPTVEMDFSAPITGAANNGSGLVRITLGLSGINLTNGTAVTVTGVVGSDGNGCGANGSFTAINQTSTTIDLQGSTFPGGCTYTSGGQFFDFQNQGPFAPIPISFNASTVIGVGGVTSLIMCKLADYNADNTCNTTSGKTAWAGGFNDDFVTKIATLQPHHLRFLNVNNQVFQLPGDYNGFETSSAFSYNLIGGFWGMTNWFGSDSGTNSYTVSCASPCTYLLTGGAPADGDYFHFYNTNANTNMSPTLTITDANSVTSSAIQITDDTGKQMALALGGTVTANDTIAFTFTTTAVSPFAGPCLAGGTHTTSAYTVLNTDTLATIQTALINTILGNDATIKALPTNVTAYNPGGTNFYIGWASNACTLSVTPVITGAATETITVGNALTGVVAANTLYTGVYNARLNRILIQSEGQSNAWPYLTQIQLAKAVSTKLGKSVGCWLQTNLLWSNASFQSLVNLENANQCPGGVIYEISNEVGWMFSNLETNQAATIANSLGLNQGGVAYLTLRSRELFALAQSTYGSMGAHYFPSIMFQLGGTGSGATNAFMQGTSTGAVLCGNSCSNPAYQKAVGTDFNANPNQPAQYTYYIGEAPYYQGDVLGTNYKSSGSYGSWSGTCSIASNVLNCSAIGSGTIFWNQGITSSICPGVYIVAPSATNPAGAQLTGTVTTTLNGAVSDNTTTWTLTSVSGVQAGMWIYDQTTNMVSGTVLSVNGGANQITVVGGEKTYRSAGSNDTIIFGGLTGTYQLNSTTCSKTSQTITGGSVAGLQAAADNYNSLNSALGSQQDALNWLYIDAYIGIGNLALSPLTTMQSMLNAWNTTSAVAVTNGQKIADYEGGYQATAPSTSQATSMGLPSTAYGAAGGYVDLMLQAFKKNTLFKTLETTRHNNELAASPSGSHTMWFAFGSGGGQWALYPGDLYSTPYQSYNAICDYNGGNC